MAVSQNDSRSAHHDRESREVVLMKTKLVKMCRLCVKSFVYAIPANLHSSISVALHEVIVKYTLLMQRTLTCHQYTYNVMMIFSREFRRRPKALILLTLLSILLIEEVSYHQIFKNVRNAYLNYYTKSVNAIIHIRRTEDDLKVAHGIAIISVVSDHHNFDNYRLAQQTFECYAIHHNYKWIHIDLSANRTLKQICPQQDLMFARHCVVAETMEHLKEQWILFIDADMGVINPNHLIEKWIDDEVSIIFYDRISNYEIMAGSYIVRNSEYGRMFLNYWADYEKRLPSSFHGTDNGAIQNVLMELMVPEKINERMRCERIWTVSKSYDDLFVYEACARDVLGTVNKWPGKAKILKKGTAWARDTWLTNSRWCESDFILHGWQKKRLDELTYATWPSPFTSHSLNMSLCGTEEAGSNWKYKDTFMRSENEIKEIIGAVITESKRSFQMALERANDYL